MNKSIGFKSLLRPASLLGAMAALAMILAACAPAATATTSPTQTASASSALTIDVASDPSLGQYLVDNNGFTLYVSTKDTADTSTCDATCQQNWPPLVSSTVPKVGPGVDASLVGLANLSNGEKIVTYDKRPLYYKLSDKVAGQTTGEDINNAWFIVSPAGQPVEAASITAPIPSPTSSSSTPAATPAVTPIAVTEPSVNIVDNTSLGNILVGANGWTMYAYALDTPDKSNCNAACQAIWLPVRTEGHPILGTGVDTSMIGTASLGDGSEILTYNHMPLYYFVNDATAGQTNGQGFDNTWFAVSPTGNMVGNVSEVTINVATDPTLGSYLVDGKGIALYIYTKDTPDTSTCTGVCATIWPPLLTLGKPTLGAGVDQSMIGTAKLADGSLVVTYNHMPLYYFVGDGKAGQVLGQGFKQVWYVLGPDGQPIMTVPTTPAASTQELKVATSPTLGQYLVNGAGMTLYAYSNDVPDQSNCSGPCLTKWPPLLALSGASYGSGVDPALVNSTTLPNGSKIVTYNDMPLYTFSGDVLPGDTNGEGVLNLWYAVSPSGQIINK